jgi:hypothetical protein
MARPLAPITLTSSCALEAARRFIGGAAGEFAGRRIGRNVDIGHMAYRTGRQPRHHQHRFCDRPAALVLIGIVGEVPALDDRKRLAIGLAPFDGRRGRVERAEPGLCGGLLRGSPAIAADRDGFAQIILAHQHHKAGLAGAEARGAAIEFAGFADDMAVLCCGGTIRAANCLGAGRRNSPAQQRRNGKSRCDNANWERVSSRCPRREAPSSTPVIWGRFSQCA